MRMLPSDFFLLQVLPGYVNYGRLAVSMAAIEASGYLSADDVTSGGYDVTSGQRRRSAERFDPPGRQVLTFVWSAQSAAMDVV